MEGGRKTNISSTLLSLPLNLSKARLSHSKQRIKGVRTEVCTVEWTIRNHGRRFYRNRMFVSTLRHKRFYNIRRGRMGGFVNVELD